MKITKELESKINRLLDGKYLPLQAENDKMLKDAKEVMIPIIQDELENLIASSIFLRTALKCELFRCNEKDLAKELAIRHIEKMPSLQNLIAEYQENRSRYKLERAREYENLAIAISYQKDLNGIREAFKESGFDF